MLPVGYAEPTNDNHLAMENEAEADRNEDEVARPPRASITLQWSSSKVYHKNKKPPLAFGGFKISHEGLST